MCLREKGTIEREVVMVTRTSKILMVIATAFTFLGVALEILLHSNQENFFPLFSAGIQLDEPVVHTVNLWSTILIFLLYLVSCIVLMSASKRTGFVMSIVALVLNLLVNAGARVGAVVMNRVKSPAYPGSIYGVIYSSGQFTPAMSGKVARVYEGNIPDACIQAAQAAINGETSVGGATYFRRAGRHDGYVIGDHVFW